MEPWPPILRNLKFIRGGTLQTGVFIGEPPWTAPEDAPDTKPSPGPLGWLEAFFQLFYTYVEPIAHAKHLRSQPPNVLVSLVYYEYEEGLQPAGLILENRSGEQVTAQWTVVIQETGERFWNPPIVLGTEKFESVRWVEIQLPPGWEPIPPYYSAEVEVWFRAPNLPLAGGAFILPHRDSGLEPYVAR